jgi:DNA polymerase epsilon subunit 3
VSNSLLQDAVLACSEAGKLFIHYLTATANDTCREARRQTISADDVLTALEDLNFGELVEPLKAALEGKQAARRSCLAALHPVVTFRKQTSSKDAWSPHLLSCEGVVITPIQADACSLQG